MTREEAIEELRVIRVRVEQVAAVLLAEEAREALLPVWDCGHRHRSRGEAVRCKAEQKQQVAQGSLDRKADLAVSVMG